MDYTVNHLSEKQCFEITVDGYTGYAKYIPGKNCLDIIHTVIPKPVEGRGVANVLIKAVYDYAFDHNLQIIPSCSYVKSWLKRHLEYSSQNHMI